ncbi:type VI secretion system membrane subunit TssM [Trinickia sp. NRRL B-1857]|uniref:type VI secretion system membrane subunit TssM n=1 Tax=Trinickia sp. NRRL B-1857 TaxID=3162879 RepID=UPI003D298922
MPTRTVVALVLGGAAVAVIWFQAPRLGFDGRSPFATTSARLKLIGGCLLAAAIWLAVRRTLRFFREVRIVRRKSYEARAARTARAHERPVRCSLENRSRVEARAIVAAALRWVRAGGPAWRWGAHSVHRLPWYLVVGERGAGKSTLARALGQRAEDRATRAVDAHEDAPVRGWFGKDAVFFEATIGDGESRTLWHALIRRMRRVRRGCPANGIVIAVSARKLIDGDDAWRLGYADSVRACIGECQRLWKRRVPVYVLVTQCDRLTGFESFAGDLSDQARASPLGLVLPLRANVLGDAWTTGFLQAFESLTRGARAQVVVRMPVRSDASGAAMTLGFPETFKALATPLSEFLRDAFEASPGSPETPLLRGVHFCAVPRKSAAAASMSPALQASPVAAGSGRACFVDGFFREVVFCEGGLARSRHAMPHQRVVVARVMAAACAVLLACAAAGLIVAYRQGSAAVAATAPSAAALVSAARAGVDLRSPREMLALLDRARGLPCGEAWQSPGGAWLVGLGLVREVHLEAACRTAYATVLRETVQPYLVERMKASLRGTSETPSKQFDTLRAYLMLGQKSAYDEASVLAWIADDASRADLSSSERTAWLAHCAAWADTAKQSPGVPLDGKLIADVRARLIEQPRAQRLFDAVMPALRAAVPEPLSVADMAGPAAALVFYRKSGARLSDGVPGAYTLAGLRRYFGVRDAILAQGRSDDWVLNRPRPAAVRPGELAASVDRLYFAGYVQAWDAVIDDVGLRPLPHSDEAAALVSLLAGRDSPLRALLARAAKETTTTSLNAEPARVASASGGIVERRVRQWLQGAATAPASEPASGGVTSASIVDDHFAALHRLVAASGEGGSSALGEVQSQLKEVAVYLRAADAAHASGLPMPPDDVLERLTQSAVTLPEPLGDMLGSLAREGTTSAQSAQRGRIDEQWRSEVGTFCHAAIDGRYPFFPSGGDDVTPDDFAHLFASGGLLDAFFQTYLKPYVDTTATPWVWRPNVAPPGMSIAALRELERAEHIREAFFSGPNKTMDVRFTLTPRAMDAGLTRFVLADGAQTLDYAHDPPRATRFQWPDRAGAAAARIEFAPASADGRHGFETHGAWALFRLMDLGRLETRAADRFVLTFALDGRSVVLDLAASSVVNPFAVSALHAFRCPSGF